MAVQIIQNLWAAAQHLFWLIYKEAWAHAGEQEKKEDLTRTEQRTNNGQHVPR